MLTGFTDFVQRFIGQQKFPLASCWLRYVARIFDLKLETVAILCIWEILLSGWEFFDLSSLVDNSYFIHIAIIPFVLFLDSCIFHFFGNTPGKAIAGLKVVTLTGDNLDSSQYLKRNFLIWLMGLALDIPIVSLFFMYLQAEKVRSGEPTSYDKKLKYTVWATPIGKWRKIVLFSFFVIWCIFGLVLLYIWTIKDLDQKQDTHNTETLNRLSEEITWLNPATKIQAKIDKKWIFSTKNNSDGQQIYMFRDDSDQNFISFSLEMRPDFTLDDYVSEFKKSNKNRLFVNSKELFFKSNDQPAWQSVGNFTDDNNIFFDVQIRQIGDNFWTIVSIQMKPSKYPDPLISDLQTSLWMTVK